MNKPKETAHHHERRRVLTMYPVLTVLFALFAIVGSFLLANSTADITTKMTGFGGIVAAFLAATVCLYFFQSRRKIVSPTSEPSDIQIERGLMALEESGQFFAGSLKPADTFRLVSSRVRDLLPFQSIVMFLLDPTRTQLCVALAEGAGADGQRDRKIAYDEALAGQCFTSRQVAIDGYLELDPTQDFGSSAAIPLCNGTEVFGVLQLYFNAEVEIEKIDHSLFEAIGTRVAPLMLTSIAFERSQVNALTDVTTDLPNERAFYLILENQIAEAVRKLEERPLTILAIDIKNFDDINSRFGHAAGDRVLNFVAQITKDNLRQMDFLARSIGDEFLAVLPTASKEISHEVIARIHTGFFGRKLKITETESVEIELNIGWASYGGDGETPGQLLSLAQLRKEQTKSIAPNKVLWFPQESAH